MNCRCVFSVNRVNRFLVQNYRQLPTLFTCLEWKIRRNYSAPSTSRYATYNVYVKYWETTSSVLDHMNNSQNLIHEEYIISSNFLATHYYDVKFV